LVIWAALAGCGGKVEPDVVLDDDPSVEEVGLPAHCEVGRVPPKTIECAGLYSNVEDKTIAGNAREFAPANPLWSDGLDKRRWLVLPKGGTIDASNPTEWKFPAGTKLFKEFSAEGKRLETRLFQKKDNGVWVHASFAWNDDETEGPSGEGQLVPMPGGEMHQIPTGDQCEQCHRGSSDSVLGFENVLLGLEGATGVTLADLVEEELIDPAPETTTLSIGDDGTGLAAPVLGWLHVNCGVTCHNSNSNSAAYAAGMVLKLDPERLDGRPSTDFEVRTTTLNVQVNNPNWFGKTRIVPGDPRASLLAELIGKRITGADDDNGQMPPIATKKVDHENVDHVIAWIESMGR
jgi:hypothetical protein